MMISLRQSAPNDCNLVTIKMRAPAMIAPVRLARGLFMALWMLALGITASAQKPHIISFDAPGADTVLHGFIRSQGGKFTTFEAPGADTTPGSYNGTYPNSINDLGVSTGVYWDVNGVRHGFLRTPSGKFTTFDIPDGTSINPIAINFEGAIVGYYTDSNYSFRAFLRRPDGTFTTWIGPDACTGSGSEGCFGSGASNLNAFGIVVGGYEDNSGNFVHHNFVQTPDGTLKTFDVPGAGTGSYQGTGCPGCALGFNQLGATAGTYIDENSVQHGFVRSPDGKFTTFEAPGAGTGSFQGTGCPSDCPTSLNDLGAIAGSYIDANDELHGYLRAPDGKIVTVDPPGTIFTWIVGINDLGAITGYYIDANGVYHGFLRIAHEQ